MTLVLQTQPTLGEAQTARTSCATSDWLTSSDAALFVGVVAHDDAAYAEVFRRHFASVTTTVRMVLGRATMGDDIVADVFVKFWVSPTLFDPDRGSLLGFLRLQAKYQSIDVLRSETSRRRRENLICNVHTDESDNTLDAFVISAEIGRSLRKAVELLPASERDAIDLAFYNGMTYRAVACKLGIPEGTAKARIRGGLRRLRQTSEQWDPGAIHDSGCPSAQWTIGVARRRSQQLSSQDALGPNATPRGTSVPDASPEALLVHEVVSMSAASRVS